MAIIRYWSRWHKMAKQPKLHQFCGHPIIPIQSLFWFPNHAWENKSCVSEIETRDRYLATRQLRPPAPPEANVLVQMDVTFTNMFSTDFLSVFTCMLCTNWMAEQSPSFCTSQLGNGFNLGNFGFNRGALGLALLPGNSTIARLSGCWLPYHLDDKYKKFLFAIFIFGEEWIYM